MDLWGLIRFLRQGDVGVTSDRHRVPGDGCRPDVTIRARGTPLLPSRGAANGTGSLFLLGVVLREAIRRLSVVERKFV